MVTTIQNIDHITMQTGHLMRRSRVWTDPSSIAAARAMLDWALDHGGTAPVNTHPGYRLNATAERSNLLATVWAEGDLPVLTIGVAAELHDGRALWDMMLAMARPPITVPPPRPTAPFIADRLEVGAMMRPDAMEWTGTISHAIAWAWLDRHQDQ